MRNRLQFVTQHPYRPIVRYDVFNVVKPGRLVGSETFTQLPLPEPELLRDTPARTREFVYVPYEESA